MVYYSDFEKNGSGSVLARVHINGYKFYSKLELPAVVSVVLQFRVMCNSTIAMNDDYY